MEDDYNNQENYQGMIKNLIQSIQFNNVGEINNINQNQIIPDILVYKKEDFKIENIITWLRDKNTKTEF